MSRSLPEYITCSLIPVNQRSAALTTAKLKNSLRHKLTNSRELRNQKVQGYSPDCLICDTILELLAAWCRNLLVSVASAWCVGCERSDGPCNSGGGVRVGKGTIPVASPAFVWVQWGQVIGLVINVAITDKCQDPHTCTAHLHIAVGSCCWRVHGSPNSRGMT